MTGVRSVPTRSVRTIPAGDVELVCISIVAPRRGCSVIVTAGVHGDEWTGTGAVERLAERLGAELDAGSVHLYPSLNPAGRARGMRRVPTGSVEPASEGTEIDLNRCFPGAASGNVADRLAHAVWTDVVTRAPDLVLDLHADSPLSVPYVLLDRAVMLGGPARARLEARALALAAETGWTVLHDFEDARYASARLDRSLSGCALNRLGVPSMTLEAGPRGVLEPGAVAEMVAALRGILVACGNLVPAAENAPVHASRVGGGPWRREIGPFAPAAGRVAPQVRAGHFVAKGAVLVHVCDPEGGVLAQVCAETEGFVVSHLQAAQVAAGAPVCTWATRERA